MFFSKTFLSLVPIFFYSQIRDVKNTRKHDELSLDVCSFNWLFNDSSLFWSHSYVRKPK